MSKTKSDKNGLTDKQLKALPHLVAASSEGEGCKKANIARQTYYDWLKIPAFRDELSRLRSSIVEDAVEALKAHTTKAVDTLVKLLDVDHPALQRNVANDILGHVAKYKELQELEQRIEIIEARSSF